MYNLYTLFVRKTIDSIYQLLTNVVPLPNPYHITYSMVPLLGVNSNGAIVHYRAVPSSAKTVGPHDMVLLDSGGQYLDGTTDVTRTFHTG